MHSLLCPWGQKALCLYLVTSVWKPKKATNLAEVFEFAKNALISHNYLLWTLRTCMFEIIKFKAFRPKYETKM